MGIIGKQSLQSSLFIYIGFAIGALNTLVLFQNKEFFTLEQFGLTRVLMDVAALIALFCTFGTSSAAVKFYPFYTSYLPPKKNDLPFITFSALIVGCLLFSIITPFFKGVIVNKYGARSPLFVEYFELIYPLTITMAFFYLLEAYSWASKKAVLPAILRELGVRVITTILIFLVMFGLINYSQFIGLYSLIYLPLVIILFAVLVKKEDLSFHFTISSVTRRLKKRIIVFSLFIFSGEILRLLARTLDSIIITSQAPGGLKDTGIFTIATYFITIMEVPVRSMTGITYAIFSQAWKDKDVLRVFNIYRKTALNLLVAGLGILGLIILNMQNVISLLGEDYGNMGIVVIILGVSKLVDLGTGLNSQLLLSSKHWKIEFVTNIFLVVMAAIFNYFLVKSYGIVGSAWATFIAFAIYNGVRFLLIYKLFKMQPFGPANLKALLIGVGAFVICWLIPFIGNVFIDTTLRSIAFVFMYGFLIVKMKISEDINAIYRKALNRVGLSNRA